MQTCVVMPAVILNGGHKTIAILHKQTGIMTQPPCLSAAGCAGVNTETGSLERHLCSHPVLAMFDRSAARQEAGRGQRAGMARHLSRSQATSWAHDSEREFCLGSMAPRLCCAAPILVYLFAMRTCVTLRSWDRPQIERFLAKAASAVLTSFAAIPLIRRKCIQNCITGQAQQGE